MKLSKKFFVSLFASSILLTPTNAINADEWDYWAVEVNADGPGKGYDIFTINNDTGEATLRDTKCIIDPNYGYCENGLSSDSAYVDPTSGDLWLQVQSNIYSYNLETDTWTDRGEKWKNNYTVVEERSSVSDSSDGSINIGSGSDILLKKTSNGEYHIGQNSLVSKEESDTQKLWGTDASGNKIPINIVDSELQIDGTGVQSQITSNATNISSNDTDISTLKGLITTKSGSTTITRIGDSTKNTLEIGPTTNPTTIDQSGISVSGSNLIKKDSDGNIHIGKNSFVIGDEVLNGAHPIWAEDENGSKIPLNIYGSDLQINGKSVQGQIDTNKSDISTNTSNISTNTSNISTNTSNISTNTSNISTNTSNIKSLGEGIAGSTALTAALTSLPQTSKESKLSCGVGSGAYSSRYALGFGCASKVNERVDINAGGSYVFGGSKSYGEGTLDSGVVKAGFVFKLGELNKTTQISMKDKKVMETKIGNLKEKNEKLQNAVSTLIARLERLEKIASKDIKSQDLVFIKN